MLVGHQWRLLGEHNQFRAIDGGMQGQGNQKNYLEGREKGIFVV
jgi:hypothetical protein